MSVFLVVLLYATWSSIFSLAKIALAVSPPIFLTSARMLLAGILILGYLRLKKRPIFAFSLQQGIAIGALGFFSMYLTNILEFWGLQYLTAAKTCLIYSLSPLFAALFSYLHFKETITPRKWLGMGIAFIGVLPVIILQTGAEELFSVFQFLSWPSLAIIGASMASVYGWVLLRLLVKDSTSSPVTINGLSMLLGGVCALIHSLFIDSWHPVPVDFSDMGSFLSVLLLITLISNLICYNLYGMMLKRFTATFLSFIGLLSPVFASMHGWIFLGETPSWIIFLSTAIISLGLWIVYSTELIGGITKATTSQPAIES